VTLTPPSLQKGCLFLFSFSCAIAINSREVQEKWDKHDVAQLSSSIPPPSFFSMSPFPFSPPLLPVTMEESGFPQLRALCDRPASPYTTPKAGRPKVQRFFRVISPPPPPPRICNFSLSPPLLSFFVDGLGRKRTERY